MQVGGFEMADIFDVTVESIAEQKDRRRVA